MWTHNKMFFFTCDLKKNHLSSGFSWEATREYKSILKCIQKDTKVREVARGQVSQIIALRIQLSNLIKRIDYIFWITMEERLDF